MHPRRFPEQTIATWQEVGAFAEGFDIAPGFQRAYIFRGQANADWTLSPTLHRSAALDGARDLPAAEQLVSLERELVDRFRQEAPNFLPPATLQSTHATIDWWTVMRHYGVPTRLLDWTTSFYVAAYFAASDSPKSDGAVFVLHISSLDLAMKAKHGEAGAFNVATIDRVATQPTAPNAVHIVGRATALLDRMVAQQCCFMCSLNVAADIEVELAENVPSTSAGGGVSLLKFRVPASLKPEIVRRLRAMNLTGATLFPGLDGVGRSLSDIVRYP